MDVLKQTYQFVLYLILYLLLGATIVLYPENAHAGSNQFFRGIVESADRASCMHTSDAYKLDVGGTEYLLAGAVQWERVEGREMVVLGDVTYRSTSTDELQCERGMPGCDEPCPVLEVLHVCSPEYPCDQTRITYIE